MSGDLRGRVAVVTGAGSGIGRALADRCAQAGMRVVLADINADDLGRAEDSLRTAGATVLAVRTDVSKSGDVEYLAHKTIDEFGEVHLLFNNAGVGFGDQTTTVWERTLADYEWMLGINFWGVVHGIRTFVPLMLRQDVESRIVNTASVAALVSGARFSIYGVTKHAVLCLSEALSAQLIERRANVKVSVVCPGFVNTRIWDGQRNRPAGERSASHGALNPAGADAARPPIRELLQRGVPPQRVAEEVFDGIRSDKFYILVNEDEWKPAIQKRMDDILQERNPL